MKKIGVLFILLLLVFNIIILASVLAEDEYTDIPGIPAGLSPEKIEDATNKSVAKWQYLQKEWKSIILKNKVVSSIDGFFTKISIVFSILFGMPYSMTFTMFVTIVLWFVFVLLAARIIQWKAKIKANLGPLIIGILLALILAHIPFGSENNTIATLTNVNGTAMNQTVSAGTTVLGVHAFSVFVELSKFLIWLIFLKKVWYWEILVFLVEVMVLIVIIALINIWSKKAKEAKEKSAEEDEEQARKVLGATVNALKEGFRILGGD